MTAVGEVFLKLVNMSMTASVMILFVVILRLLFRKAPRQYCCILWMLVGLRLICPVTLESAVSLLPSAEPIPEAVLESRSMWVETGIEVLDRPVNSYFQNHYFEGVSVPADHKKQILKVLAWVWLAGVVGMLAYSGVSFWYLRRRLKTAVLLRDNLWQSEQVKSPFILGMFRPKIYLPFDLEEPQLTYVLAHERAHIRRGDHFAKPVGFLLLSVHWFNPFIWLAFCLFCRDLEQACDERAIRGLDDAGKKEYARSLFRFSVRGHGVGACPVAFGEAGVKERIKSVLRYHQPALWVAVLAAVGCVAAGVCILTNPRESAGQTEGQAVGRIEGQTGGRTEGQAGGQTDGRTDGQTDERTEGQTGERTDGQAGERTEGQTGGRIEGQTSGRTDGQAGGQTGGRADGQAVGNGGQEGTNPAGGNAGTDNPAGELSLDMVAAMGDNDDFLHYDFSAFSNGVRNDHEDPALNYDIIFSYELAGDELQLVVSAYKEDDSLGSVRLQRESNRDVILIYSVGNEYRSSFLLSEAIAGHTADRDVRSFLEHAYTLQDDISYELPEGLTESAYRADLGFAGAILLQPDAYEVYGDENSYAPAEWTAAGMISRFYTADLVVWDGDVIQEIYPFFNHTSEEALGSVDGLAAPGFLQKCNHDLYTIPELDELAEQGIEIPESETTSDFWYVYLAKPGEETGFVVSLNAKNFTREDAIAFAGSIKWK